MIRLQTLKEAIFRSLSIMRQDLGSNNEGGNIKVPESGPSRELNFAALIVRNLNIVALILRVYFFRLYFWDVNLDLFYF